ncbi:leucine-rich repeat protein 1-like [Musca vetustissima]|uniref:leucine-rich repeat protein 1-like n=1 Tax=Musca vetustissima TaxID=27455 RepID=UPI002AB6E784|nr:leucine-rich repeat protein 1-like [Musca vetustissima]
MKILCETQVQNRLTQANKTPRMVKATLAVGFNTTAKDHNGESNKDLEIILFTPQEKNGVRYKVKNNIEKMFTKFLKDGKATISFKQPAENLMIKCDPIQLKGFLQTLKLGLEGKDSINLRMNIASATAIPQKSQPQTKMNITSRGDYPTKGFPRTLKSLTITGIKLCKVTYDMCSLRNLTTLNLSYNTIEKIPNELGRLALVELNLSNNNLGDKNAWQWMKGKTIQASLKDLDLSANKLEYFPPPLIKYEKLVTLKLNNNQLIRLPQGIRRMRSLRFVHLSINKLESLPAAFNIIPLEMLDVWGNNFQELKEYDLDVKSSSSGPSSGVQNLYNCSPLWLQAARVVCQHKLPYSPATLPWILVDILSEAPKCACGKLCYGDAVLERAAMATFENVKNLVFSRDRLIYADIVLCGPQCAGRKQILAT